MQFLRSNTAVIITVGPFYDKTDGVTIKGALTITNEKISLTADTDAGSAPTNILDNVTGATSGTANDLNYITGTDAGYMQLELAAADVNRVGRMSLSITDAANHVPVFHELFVLPAVIYDWLTAGAAPLSPTTAGHTLDVSATGEAGVDWANVGSPTTTVGLTGTTIATTQKVDIETIKTNPVVNAGTITFPTTATLASTTNITAGTVTTATNVTTVNGLANDVITAASIANNAIGATEIADGAIDAATFAAGAIDASAIAANAIGSSELATTAVDEIVDAVWDELLSGHAVSGSTGEALSAAGTAGDPWTTALPGSYGSGTAGKIIGDNINATISSRATQTSVDTIDDFVDTEIAAIKTVVDDILVDTAEIGTAGAGLTNINLPNQTMDIVGNITGNLSGSVGSVTGAVGSVTAPVTAGTVSDKTGYGIGVGGIAATAFAAGAIDAAAIATDAIGAAELAQGAAQEVADEVLDRNLAGGGSGNSRNVRNALRALRNKVDITAGTATVYQEDDSTSAWTATISTAAGDPIKTVDPA